MQVSSITRGIVVAKSDSQNAKKIDFESALSAASTQSTQVSISNAAKERSASQDVDGSDVQGGFRVDPSQCFTLRDLVQSGRPVTVIKLTDAEAAEVKLHDEQMAARESANRQYALQHPDQIYGQVLAQGEDGKMQVVSTVMDSGVAGVPNAYASISMPEGEAGTQLAEARLQEIAEALHGTIIRSNFFPILLWVARIVGLLKNFFLKSRPVLCLRFWRTSMPARKRGLRTRSLLLLSSNGMRT